jgi:hypothetical protein
LIVKGLPDPIVCKTWFEVTQTLGELQRLDLEAEWHLKV